MIAALFVDPRGVYSGLDDVECWGEEPVHNSASCFGAGARGTNMSPCRWAASMRRHAIEKYRSSISTPMNFRPSRAQAMPVVPLLLLWLFPRGRNKEYLDE